MNGFLEQIVNKISPEELPNLVNWTYVFPSKRSGKFFEEYLQQRFNNQTFWSPEILGIEDFVFTCSGITPTDNMSLIFTLFSVYKDDETKLEFEKFYAWGEILLSDFEEIDRYMVNAAELFEGLEGITKLEETFGDNEELLQAYQEFVKLFSDNPDTELIRRFTRNWRRMFKVYSQFNKRIATEDLWYPGKIFRNLAEAVVDDVSFIPYEKVVFAGFNALSLSEEKIITSLLEAGKAEVYWDSDKLYMANEQDEAGKFLRDYKKKWRYPGVHFLETNMLEDEKELQFIGCPQLVTQAKQAGNIIKQNGLEATTNTAVILCDENLLVPALHSIDAKEVNVTMGYPFRNTSLFQFISDIIRFQSDVEKNKKLLCSGEQVLALVKNTLVSPVFVALSAQIASEIRKNKLRWIHVERLLELCGDSWLKFVFVSAADSKNLLENISQFLVKLFYHLKDEGLDEHVSSLEIIYHGLKYLRRFQEDIQSQKFEPSLRFLHHLYLESFRTLKIPFSGEPLKGLQIMGFLETRALDFKNVLILGANEGKVPKSKHGQTYLPFIARKAFGLPTFEEQDAIYSYHFKRVLQRAEKIFILYDTEVAVDGSGEKSRFLRQLHYQFKSRNTHINLLEKKVMVSYSNSENENSIEVTKTRDVLKRLERFESKGKENQPLLSPTALATYLDCKLRFYLRYVAKVPEEETSMDEIDKRIFGQILHLALEKAYRPFEGKTLDRDTLKQISQDEKIRQYVQEALYELQLVRKDYGLSGKDLLLESVIRRLVKKVILQDEQNAPVQIISVEQRLQHEFTLKNGKKVVLGGVVDRLDRIKKEDEEFMRVIDYKTGKVDMLGATKATIDDPLEYLKPYFEDGRYKSGFQAYYYTMLIQLLYTGEKLKSAIYELKKMRSGMKYLRGGNVISMDLLNSFRLNTQELIEEIYNPDMNFTQTTDTKKCLYCPYNSICER